MKREDGKEIIRKRKLAHGEVISSFNKKDTTTLYRGTNDPYELLHMMLYGTVYGKDLETDCKTSAPDKLRKYTEIQLQNENAEVGAVGSKTPLTSFTTDIGVAKQFGHGNYISIDLSNKKCVLLDDYKKPLGDEGKMPIIRGNELEAELMVPNNTGFVEGSARGIIKNSLLDLPEYTLNVIGQIKISEKAGFDKREIDTLDNICKGYQRNNRENKALFIQQTMLTQYKKEFDECKKQFKKPISDDSPEISGKSIDNINIVINDPIDQLKQEPKPQGGKAGKGLPYEKTRSHELEESKSISQGPNPQGKKVGLDEKLLDKVMRFSEQKPEQEESGDKEKVEVLKLKLAYHTRRTSKSLTAAPLAQCQASDMIRNFKPAEQNDLSAPMAPGNTPKVDQKQTNNRGPVI